MATATVNLIRKSYATEPTPGDVQHRSDLFVDGYLVDAETYARIWNIRGSDEAKEVLAAYVHEKREAWQVAGVAQEVIDYLFPENPPGPGPNN